MPTRFSGRPIRLDHLEAIAFDASGKVSRCIYYVIAGIKKYRGTRFQYRVRTYDWQGLHGNGMVWYGPKTHHFIQHCLRVRGHGLFWSDFLATMRRMKPAARERLASSARAQRRAARRVQGLDDSSEDDDIVEDVERARPRFKP